MKFIANIDCDSVVELNGIDYETTVEFFSNFMSDDFEGFYQYALVNSKDTSKVYLPFRAREDIVAYMEIPVKNDGICLSLKDIISLDAYSENIYSIKGDETLYDFVVTTILGNCGLEEVEELSSFDHEIVLIAKLNMSELIKFHDFPAKWTALATKKRLRCEASATEDWEITYHQEKLSINGVDHYIQFELEKEFAETNPLIIVNALDLGTVEEIGMMYLGDTENKADLDDVDFRSYLVERSQIYVYNTETYIFFNKDGIVEYNYVFNNNFDSIKSFFLDELNKSWNN